MTSHRRQYQFLRMRHIKLSLMIILSLSWKGITSQVIHSPGYSIQVSPSVSVQEGLCATIPCTFTAGGRNTFTNSFGYWLRLPHDSNTFNIVATNNKSSVILKPNFHLTGNPDTGDCTLTITGARKEDEGGYFFRFEESKYSNVKYSYIKEIITTITVTDLTEEPFISDLGTVTAGINKTVTCAPPGNCFGAPVVIQWKKSDVPGIWKNSPTVTFTPSLDDNQKTITCEMTNFRRKTTQKHVLLDVYPPSINTEEDTNACSMDSSITIVMVIGNIVALILINVGSYFCLKRRMEKRQLEKGSSKPGTQAPESIYQELKGQKISVYNNIKA